jgi:hypothetical protein
LRLRKPREAYSEVVKGCCFRRSQTRCSYNCHKIPLRCTQETLNRGEHIGAFSGHRVASESVSMQQALFPTDAPAVTFPRRSDTIPSQAPGSCDLQQLGERLRLTYGPVEAPLPARLAELVERLVRREQTEN